MRNRGLECIYTLAQKDPRVLFIGSDIGIGTLAEFQKKFPKQFFVEGISEAYLIGMAAGLASNNKIPYINTIATFLTRRCYEQIAIDLCMSNLNVRLYGNGGGLVYAPLGPTHTTVEDIAIMNALPNMTIIAPCDADEMERAIFASHLHIGPIYIRVARGGDQIVSKKEFGFKIGKAIVYKEPTDFLIITTGIMLQRAIAVCQTLEKQGVEGGIIHAHTVKPFDNDIILSYLKKVKYIITLEEHSIMGGLGSIVASIIAQNNYQNHLCIKGIPDVFPEKYGRQEDLLEYYHLHPQGIAGSILNLLKAS